MVNVEGDETGDRAGSAAGLYVALVCAVGEAAPGLVDCVLEGLEMSMSVRDRCDACAFADTCVKRALAGGLVRARAWVVRTEQAGVRLVGR